jgi:hypothetical protein
LSAIAPYVNAATVYTKITLGFLLIILKSEKNEIIIKDRQLFSIQVISPNKI